MYIVMDSFNEEIIGPFEDEQTAMFFIEEIEAETSETNTLILQLVTPPQEWYEDNVLAKQLSHIV